MAVASRSASKRIRTDENEKIKKSEEGKKSQKQAGDGCPSRRTRTKDPGVRVIGARIYDSQNGKSCHQCRQKTLDFAAVCKNKKQDKSCPIKFCYKCLLNRYGEKAEEMSALEDWKCPKCRGICNCSNCMKKRGQPPTGILAPEAKATGFSSVSEMLQAKGSQSSGIGKIETNVAVSPKRLAASRKEPTVVFPRKRGKENSCGSSNLQTVPLELNSDENKPKKMKVERFKKMRKSDRGAEVLSKEINPKQPRISNGISEKGVKAKRKFDGIVQDRHNSKAKPSKDVSSEPSRKEKRKEEMYSSNQKDAKLLVSQKTDNNGEQHKTVVSCIAKRIATKTPKTPDAEIPLLGGTELTTVAGIDLQPEDIGHALQFLEFCAAFGKILHVKKGYPEAVLREIIHGRSGRRSQYSLIAQFHIQLLSLIQRDLGEESPKLSSINGKNSWLHALKNYISDSPFVPKDLSLSCLDGGADGYDSLDSSKKLILLNFLCDEVLGKEEIRNWIDDQNLKFAEKLKEAKERVIAAKNKEKHLKRKLQDEVAEAIIAKNGAPLTISEHDAIVLQIKTEAARARAEMLESKGMVPKNKQISDAVRTQPIVMANDGRAFWRLKGYSDKYVILLQDMTLASGERWFAYNAEHEKTIEKHIYSLRKTKASI